MNGVDITNEAVVKAMDKKHIGNGVVRPIDKNILWMAMVGASDKEIAREMGVTRYAISTKLRNPIIQRELERLGKIVDKEIVSLTVASKRRMQEASLAAADALVSMIEQGSLPAIVKVLEFTHGKPRQSVAISPGGDKRLSDDDEKILDVMVGEGKDD